MITLIAGASHTGKTLLAKRLMAKYGYNYLSVDLLKMGLIRSGNTAISVLDDVALKDYLWPIVVGIIKTAIENQQDLIIEGIYIADDYRRYFDGYYLPFIKYVALIFSDEYIRANYQLIMDKANVVEKRHDDQYLIDDMLMDNHHYLKQCHYYQNDYHIINNSYDVEVDLDVFLENDEYCFKKLNHNDFEIVKAILQDDEVMHYWNHHFSDDDVADWIAKCVKQYQSCGYGYCLLVDKKSNQYIGMVGLLDEVIDNQHQVGLGYILSRKYWHLGHATKACQLLINLAFDKWQIKKVVSTIRIENTNSIGVSKRLNMVEVGSFEKLYRGQSMMHVIYQITNL